MIDSLPGPMQGMGVFLLGSIKHRESSSFTSQRFASDKSNAKELGAASRPIAYNECH